MKTEDVQKLRARFRRLAGQVRALEEKIEEDPETFVRQVEAVIAASRASLRFYVEARLLSDEALSKNDRALLARLIEKFS